MNNNSYFPLTLKLVALTGLIGLGNLTVSQALAQTESELTLNARPAITVEGNSKLAQTTQVGSLVAVAKEDEDLSTFVEVVEESGLEETLASEDQQYTVFAPSNEAFEALPPGTVEELKKPENRELLREVLTYHVAEGTTTSQDLSTGGVETLGGGLAVRVDDDDVVVNDASVTQANVEASNGVIHKVNRVLLTRQLRTRVLALTQTPVRALW